MSKKKKFGDRRDARKIKMPAMMRLLTYITNRQEAMVYINRKLDVTELVKYVDKLKKNGSYLVDHYVSYNELNIDNLLLNSNSKDTYLLEWKWVSSDNDTEIGFDITSNYKLSITVGAIYENN